MLSPPFHPLRSAHGTWRTHTHPNAARHTYACSFLASGKYALRLFPPPSSRPAMGPFQFTNPLWPLTDQPQFPQVCRGCRLQALLTSFAQPSRARHSSITKSTAVIQLLNQCFHTTGSSLRRATADRPKRWNRLCPPLQGGQKRGRCQRLLTTVLEYATTLDRSESCRLELCSWATCG